MAGTKIGFLKRKLGLRGETKSGDMISRMNAMKKMSMKEWESSSMDKKLDRKLGYKEGSKEDKVADKKALAKFNAKKNTKSKSCGMKEKFDPMQTIKNVSGKVGNFLKSGAKFYGDFGKAFVRNISGQDIHSMLKKKTKGIKTTGKSFGKSNKLGGGGRFAQVKHAVSGKKGVYNPAGLAAYIGRKSLGKAKFQKLAAQGKKHA